MNIVSAVLRGFSWIADQCIPAAVKANPEAENQARMFLISHVFGPPLGLSAPIALYVVDPVSDANISVLALSVLGFWAFPFMMRAGVPYRWLVRLSITELNFAVYWSMFQYGGIFSPTITWVLIIPILVVFYVGGNLRRQYDLIIINLISVVIFGLAFTHFAPPPSTISAFALSMLGALSAVAVMAYIALMAIYYARIVNAGVELENEAASRYVMEERLRNSVAAAHASARAKSEFLARMSHELRSPLNAIIGYGELMREEEEDTPGQEVFLKDIDRILDAGSYLKRLIDIILDLAKIDSGKMTFDIRPHDLGGLLKDLVASYESEMAKKGQQIMVSIAPETSKIDVDAMRFAQIADYLLKNACQYTDAGHISVWLQLTKIGQVRHIRLIVKDTGRGIAPELLESIFDGFEMNLDAADGRYGGSGLELSVARKLCQAMGGDIHVASTLDRGSTFTVTLPCEPPVPVTSVGTGALSHAC